jgi:hypothetical protein
MTLFSASHVAASTPGLNAAVETGAYRGWWWFRHVSPRRKTTQSLFTAPVQEAF